MFKRVTKARGILILLTLFLTLNYGNANAQNFISVPFANGFVGNNTANNEASNCYYLNGLGWKNVQFAQNSTANIFVAQGNDIIGMVIITDNNNVEHIINGFVKWRAPSGNVTTIVFQPGPSTNVQLATNSTNGSSTYTIDGTKYIGLTFNGQTLTINPVPGTVNGNAATSGLLDALNNYLNSFPRIIVFGANTSAADTTVVENAGSKNINIRLTAPSTNTIKVRYRTIQGTALAGQDYTTVQDTLTFLPNDTIETINIPIINNLVVEPNEYFDINLFEPINAVLLNPTRRMTIIDDDVVNTPPNANDDQVTIFEDSTIQINVLANDLDTTGIFNLPTIKTQPLNGTVTVNQNGTITYIPNANYFGVDSFMYKVCDNGTPSLCDSAWVRLTINAVNDAPNANDDNPSLNEDTPISINVRSNDTDVDGTLNNPTIAINPANGTVVVAPNGNITYTPNPNFFGVDSFMYKVCDNSTPSLCDSAWVRLTINGVNDAPDAVNDTINLQEDNSATFNVRSNDTDVDGTLNNPAIISNPTNGTVVVAPNGNITYTPNPNFFGVDSFMYKVCDNSTPSLCDSAWVRLNVASVNDAPNANDDNPSLNEDTPISINVRSNDTDVDGTLNNPTVAINPANGSVVVNPNGNITYTPNPNFFGVDSFMYKVCDNSTPSLCDSAWVRLTINGVNDAPDAVNDNINLQEDNSATFNVRSNDTDVDGTLNNPAIISNPTNGTVVVAPNGNITYTPNPNFFGIDSFMYKVCDNSTPSLCDSAWVTLNVASVNDAPIINADTLNSNGTGPFVINVLNNDTDDGGLNNPIINIAPRNGTAIVNANGTITYTPNPNFFGVDSFMYKVCDNSIPALCDSAWVRINLSATNNAPVANDDNYTINEDTPSNLNVRSNDTDLGGSLLNPTALINPKKGTISINPNGTILYTPNLNFFGPDSFMYKVCDNGSPSLCDSAWVRITIQAVNDRPDAITDTITVNEDGSVTIDLRNNDTDVEGGINPPTLPIPPANGTVTVNPNGSITYIPKPNYFGADSFMYKICDNGTPILCDSAWVKVNINPINDRPIIKSDTITVNEDGTITVDVRLNDTDDGILNPPTLPIPPAKGTIVINPDGSITYIPNPDVFGPDSFMYKVCDNGTPVLCDSAWVKVNINPVNDRPEANDDVAATFAGQPAVINVRLNDVDKEGGLNNPVILTNPVNGSVVVNANGTITYTPNPNYFGTDSFMYKVCDNGSPALCDSAWVKISNNQIYPDPIVNDDNVNGTEDQPIVIDVKLNDNIGDGSNNPPVVIANPGNGTVVITPDGKINYTPDPDFNGVDSFMYKICNNANPAKCDSAWVRVNVDAVNDAPEANDDAATVNKNSTIDIDVRNNDADKEGASTMNTPVVIVSPNNGIISINPNGTIKYTPSLNYVGVDSFMYKVCDNGTPVLCDSAWVRIIVLNTGTAPIAINDTLVITQNGQGKINVIRNDYHPSGSDIGLPQIIGQPLNGTLLPISLLDTTYMYVPNSGYVGSDKFTYVITDANDQNLKDTADVIIIINAVEVKVPGGFSPDNDGINDVFIIPGIEKYPNNKLTIVNRWGEAVYFKERYNNEWTGEPNRGLVMEDGKVPAGTYFYILETGTGSKPISGSIYINR